MSIPGLLVNTYIKQNKKTDIDLLSKLFIITECAMGLNRSPILDIKRKFYTVMLYVYAALVYALLLWHNILIPRSNYVMFLMTVKYTQYVSCSIISFLTWKRIRDFYCGLERFDSEVGCRPRIKWQSLKICGQIAVVTFCTFFTFHVHTSIVFLTVNIPVCMVTILENHLFAHMLTLLTTRLRMLNEYLESSLGSAKNRVETDRKLNIKIERLMDIYNIIIEAHVKLINGAKWQLLLIITTSFLFVLGLCFRIAVDMIRENVFVPYTLIKSAVSLVEFLPVFAPCLCSDQLRAEVQRLKQLLASKLYEGSIDKPSRSSVRTLLALLETRDLSFPLLRTVDVSISLPFKFTGLLVTYLIILLQFEKVIR